MPRSPTIADSLAKLLDDSNRPIYVVDATRRIAYCNAALAHWIDLERKQIVGRRVEFHSEPQPEIAVGGDDIPLTELCPPPSALAGEAGKGTISCQRTTAECCIVPPSSCRWSEAISPGSCGIEETQINPP